MNMVLFFSNLYPSRGKINKINFEPWLGVLEPFVPERFIPLAAFGF